jgi:PAS domain S-box-containing protein
MEESARTKVRHRSRVPRLGFVALICLLIVANGVVALVVLAQIRWADAEANHALRITFDLRQLNILVDDYSTAQRSYRLSGDEQRLKAYHDEVAQLPALFARLSGLIGRHSEEKVHLANLELLIDQDTAALAASLGPVDLHFADGRMPEEFNQSIRRSSAIVTAIESMQQDESRSLLGHLSVAETRNAVMLGTVGFGAFGSLVLIIIMLKMWSQAAQRSDRLAEASAGALEESEQRFHRIFEDSPLGMLLMHHDDQHIVQANPAFCRMLGYSAEQLAGRSIGDITHIDDRDLLPGAVARAGQPGGDVAARFVTRSASVASAHITLTELRMSDRSPGLLLALVEDVSREKRVEAELRQAQKMEAIGQLTGGIAHDFNNLLGVIIGNAEFLLDAVQSDPANANLTQEILDSALSGADLTRRLLAFARRQALQPRLIDLNTYLPNNVAIIRRLLGETIQVAMTLQENLWPTRADPSQVGDALLNLAINARDAMPHGGRLHIRTSNERLDVDEQNPEVAQGDYVLLTVTDTGTGMPPEVLERAVEPFFTTKEPGAGSGLGLSMIFGFAKQSGGHLSIESEPGQGTRVQLYLPRAEGPDEEEVDNSAEPTMPVGQESILLVDDNAEMRAVARRHLTSLGYRVEEADSGPRAVEVLQSGHQFELLFTDILMPDGMTGYHLAKIARQMRPELKVLFTTGYARPEATITAADLQLGLVLRKPYRKHELAEAVRSSLDV